MSTICPECGSRNSPTMAFCTCGRKISIEKGKFPLYLAAIPLILPFLLLYRSPSVTSSIAEGHQNPRFCVQTLGVKLTDGQILSGTARNLCSGPVRNVHLLISAIDENGKHRAESVEIKQLDAGGAKRFERVLGGRVKSWDVASDR